MKFKKIIFPNFLLDCHYNGWFNIIDAIKDDIIDTNEDVVLDSFVDNCCWENKENMTTKWIGIVHTVASDPDNLHHVTLKNLVHNVWFVNNKDKCTKLITLSKYTASVLRTLIDIPVINLYHPKMCDTTFNIKKYLTDPTINQSGFHSRNIEKFANFNTKIKKKLYVNKEHNKLYVSRFLSNIIHNIEVQDCFLSDDKYISNLVSGIGFAYYSDVAASNSLLEHIVSHTPIVVNRHPAVMEYIGKDYPLFYEDIQNDPDHYLLNKKYIIECSDYLKERSKLDIFSMEKFKQDLLSI